MLAVGRWVDRRRLRPAHSGRRDARTLPPSTTSAWRDRGSPEGRRRAAEDPFGNGKALGPIAVGTVGGVPSTYPLPAGVACPGTGQPRAGYTRLAIVSRLRRSARARAATTTATGRRDPRAREAHPQI